MVFADSFPVRALSSIIHGRKEYVRYDAGTSSESKNVVVIR